MVADEMVLKFAKGPLVDCCCAIPWDSSGLGESPSPAMNLVKRPSSQFPMLSRLGLDIFPGIHEPDLSSCGAAVKRSDRPFSCSTNVTLMNGEPRLRAVVMASQ